LVDRGAVTDRKLLRWASNEESRVCVWSPPVFLGEIVFLERIGSNGKSGWSSAEGPRSSPDGISR
jgi:hypothetical protein